MQMRKKCKYEAVTTNTKTQVYGRKPNFEENFFVDHRITVKKYLIGTPFKKSYGCPKLQIFYINVG